MKRIKNISLSLKVKEIIGLNKIINNLIKEKKPKRLSIVQKEAVLDGLSKVEVQIDEIKAMVESDDDYSSIIKKVEYSRRSLNAAEILLLERHSVPLQ